MSATETAATEQKTATRRVAAPAAAEPARRVTASIKVPTEGDKKEG